MLPGNQYLKINGAQILNSVVTFANLDTSPNVAGSSYFNTNTSAVTIRDFDDGGDRSTLQPGHKIIVVSKGMMTFDVTSTKIKGGTTDIVTDSGDVTTFLYDGNDWLVVGRIDMSDDLN